MDPARGETRIKSGRSLRPLRRPPGAFAHAAGAGWPGSAGRSPCNRRYGQKLCETRPSRSFGSNQVDFGGMISPASAIAIS